MGGGDGRGCCGTEDGNVAWTGGLERLGRLGPIRSGQAARPGQVDGEGAGQLRPAAFEDAYFEPAATSSQSDAEHGGRGLGGEVCRPDQDQGGGAFFGGQLQPAQGAHVGCGKP